MSRNSTCHLNQPFSHLSKVLHRHYELGFFRSGKKEASWNKVKERSTRVFVGRRWRSWRNSTNQITILCQPLSELLALEQKGAKTGSAEVLLETSLTSAAELDDKGPNREKLLQDVSEDYSAAREGRSDIFSPTVIAVLIEFFLPSH